MKIKIFIFIALLVQLVERKSPKFNAEGSSPSGRAIVLKNYKIRWFENKIKIIETNINYGKKN
jgi:hypothetical protein